MNYIDLYSSYSDPTIAAAWESQVKEVDKTSWLAESLVRRESELFPRFAACYAELLALPRGARRTRDPASCFLPTNARGTATAGATPRAARRAPPPRGC